jgi:hypothetical protein
MGISSQVMQRQTPLGLTLPLPSPLLAMLPEDLQGRAMQWWVQPANALNVIHNAAGVAGFATDSSHFFAAWYGCVSIRSADDQTDLTLNFPATVLITDTHNLNYQPANVPADIRNVFGTATQPSIWPSPLIVEPNSGLNIAVTNLHNATAANFRFAYLGVLISK